MIDGRRGRRGRPRDRHDGRLRYWRRQWSSWPVGKRRPPGGRSLPDGLRSRRPPLPHPAIQHRWSRRRLDPGGSRKGWWRRLPRERLHAGMRAAETAAIRARSPPRVISVAPPETPPAAELVDLVGTGRRSESQHDGRYRRSPRAFHGGPSFRECVSAIDHRADVRQRVNVPSGSRVICRSPVRAATNVPAVGVSRWKPGRRRCRASSAVRPRPWSGGGTNTSPAGHECRAK